jgi:hypothetical protein
LSNQEGECYRAKELWERRHHFRGTGSGNNNNDFLASMRLTFFTDRLYLLISTTAHPKAIDMEQIICSGTPYEVG